MEPSDSDPATSRRAVLASAVGIATLSGCGDAPVAGSGGGASPTSPATESPGAPTTGAATDPERVRLLAEPGVYRFLDAAADLWNANPAPADSPRWSPATHGIEASVGPATHFARLSGAEPAAAPAGAPPFEAVVELADVSPERGDPFDDGTYDAVCVTREEGVPEATDGSVRSRVVARTGLAVVVSPAVAAAGVDVLSGADLVRLFGEDRVDWPAVGGPDRPVFAFTGADPNGPDTPLEAFLRERGAAPVGVDERGCGLRTGSRWRPAGTTPSAPSASAPPKPSGSTGRSRRARRRRGPPPSASPTWPSTGVVGGSARRATR
ncbi:hypothetical protein ACFQRB_18665 [Halobaculum litoreum]|uniref:Uncharacterized protein n=1 Tax=Halobaculum litoreum TaxID=3031998 RepID=A0ABD5XXV9_9EURY